MNKKPMLFHRYVSALLVLLPFSLPATAASLKAPTPLLSVDPFVGTDAHGHMYPGATVPFGMVQLSPDTRTEGWDACAGYHYDDTVIQGFTHTHLSGTGCGDLGDILLMPTIGDVHLAPGTPGNGYVSRFSHKDEQAHPGYYRVFLQNPKVTAELTATPRCGLHRYTFPASKSAHFVLDLSHGIGNTPYDCGINVENDTTISGYKKTHGWSSDRAIYFVMRFSKPFASFGIAKNGQQLPQGTRTAQDARLQAFVTYQTAERESILVKVGISGTGIEGARKNLDAEIPGFDFAATRAAAEKRWADALGVVQIDTPDPHLRRTFYTSLYDTMLAPTLYDNVDLSYMGMDHQVHHPAGFHNYTEFSLWDTYRAEHPLLTLVQPGRVPDLMASLMAEYRENGAHSTPIWPLWGNETWCMIGYHSVPVLVDAYFKGFRGFDPEAAYQAMRDTAMQDRSGLYTYKKLGYVASTPGQQATSKTLEYAFDDWCLARMAQALGHVSDARMFYKRSASYRNIFDRTVGFMRGRKANGAWRSPFKAIGLVDDEYTEADAWQYSFCVQHDAPGLIGLYGGDAKFIAKLDAMFAADPTILTDDLDITGKIGQLVQGDEQCHHTAYLYDYAGAPYKTQQWVRRIMTQLYNDTPSGQCGNDDCGQMSAWYVFSALGFYPVNPASGVYAIGSPAVSRATLHLDDPRYGNRTFTIIADNNSPRNVYIESAALNGKPLRRAYLTHAEIAVGGTLHLTMGPAPNRGWGQAITLRPPPGMPAGFRYAALPAPSTRPKHGPWIFPIPIRIACGSEDPVGGFIPDPGMTDADVNGADTPIDLSTPNAAPAGVYQNERYAQDFTYAFNVPINRTYRVRLHFAEIFDHQARERIENVSINGKPALTDFDIYAAAGGNDKAVVKEFDGITPDSSGKIAIRIAAVPSSPDQHAKINGIEILPE